MKTPKRPVGLGPGGRYLWDSLIDVHDLDAQQVVQLVEACRMKDRLDQMDAVLRGDVDTWVSVQVDKYDQPVSLRVDAAVKIANETANTMKQLLAAMRLPDVVTGKRPQRRGARGVQKPSVPGGAKSKVTALDAARARKSS